jgi:hypothetical protein
VEGLAVKHWEQTETPSYRGDGHSPRLSGLADLSGVPKARDTQVGGDHYIRLKVTHFDAVEAWLTPEQAKGHYLGCAIKYLTRYNATSPGKGGLPDVQKAAHYLEKLIELEVAK